MDDGVRSDPGEGERFDDGVRVALSKAALPHLTVLELTLGEEAFLAGPGSFVAAPPGVRHGFKVPPGGFEDAMRRMNA